MTYIRIRFGKRGGHYHCRVFTAQNYDGTFANCGTLVFDEREFVEVRDKLSRCEWIEDTPSDDGAWTCQYCGFVGFWEGGSHCSPRDKA